MCPLLLSLYPSGNCFNVSFPPTQDKHEKQQTVPSSLKRAAQSQLGTIPNHTAANYLTAEHVLNSGRCQKSIDDSRDG